MAAYHKGGPVASLAFVLARLQCVLQAYRDSGSHKCR